MKVLHVTTSSKGGAGIAALRLHEALCKSGVLSAYISTNLTIDFNNKAIEDSFFCYKKPSLLKKIIIKIVDLFTISKNKKIVNDFHLLEKKMQFEIATLPFSKYKLHEHPLVKEADIINLHWIDGIVDYASFFQNCTKPIVWTFHDMNPFLGIFHYKNDEIANTEIALSFDSRIKKIKKDTIKCIKHGVLVTPSKWLLEEALKTDVYTDFEKISIPNSIDFEVFKILNKNELRIKYDIKENEFVVLFVADSIKNHRKGFDILSNSLALLENSNITIVTVGKGVIPMIDNLKIISLGEIKTSSKMAECYSLADVFVLPSREDNLPNVMLESFACGIPMIGFNVGGIAEHTIENVTGILATEISAEALAFAITQMKITIKKYNSDTIRKYAFENFSNKKQAELYIKIYNSIFNKTQVKS